MAYLFDDVELNAETFEVRRGGRVVDVEPKVFDLIVCLVENRHRVVTKEELLNQVWAGRTVVESVLTRAVCLARKAVGQPRIETRHGRGYRFLDEPAASKNLTNPKDP